MFARTTSLFFVFVFFYTIKDVCMYLTEMKARLLSEGLDITETLYVITIMHNLYSQYLIIFLLTTEQF